MNILFEAHAPSLIAMIKAVVVMLPHKSEKREHLKGVNLIGSGNTIRVQATNGKCIATGKLHVDNLKGDFEITLPSATAIEISKLKQDGYCVAYLNENFELKFTSKTVVCKPNSLKFPDLYLYLSKPKPQINPKPKIKTEADTSVGVDWKYLELVVKSAKAIRGKYTGLTIETVKPELRFIITSSNEKLVSMIEPLLIVVMPLRI